MDLPIIFAAGMPRSGSTLLVNFLGQNPTLFPTPTSGLPDSILAVRENWWKNTSWRAQGLAKIKPCVQRMIGGMLSGFYAPQFAEGRTVLEKSRGWIRLIPQMEEALGHQIRVIVTVRDVRACVASLEKLYRKSPWTIQDMGPGNVGTATVQKRVGLWMSDNGLIGAHIEAMRNISQIGLGDRLILVPYRALCQTPLVVIDDLYGRFSLDPFEHDPNNVQQITHEDDTVHGMELHTIRPVIELPEGVPWQDILPDPLAAQIADEFVDINNIANGTG